ERTLLKADEDRESRRILRKLSSEVGKFSRHINAALDVIARVDLIASKAKFSREFHMSAPDLNDDGQLWLRSARHPLLEQIFRQAEKSTGERREVVPIEVKLGVGFNILVITGPNTGGKTVALKTTGLLALMAQSGMHIPATEGSAVPVFEHIL